MEKFSVDFEKVCPSCSASCQFLEIEVHMLRSDFMPSCAIYKCKYQDLCQMVYQKTVDDILRD